MSETFVLAIVVIAPSSLGVADVVGAAGHARRGSDKMAMLGATNVNVPPWTIGNLEINRRHTCTYMQATCIIIA